jgi:hypothetical protein
MVALGTAILCVTTLFWLESPSMLRPLTTVGSLLMIALLAAALVIISGGLICLWRDEREEAGKPDLFARMANKHPTRGVMSRIGLRFVLGFEIRPGDVVEVKSKREISATLDSAETLDGLPFMAEMEEFCGKVFVVHRRVDKINDMRHKTGLRRLRNTVTLTDARCSGRKHGGCEAECQILWKESWLRLLPSPPPVIPHETLRDRSIAQVDEKIEAQRVEYVCQMTQLWEASHSMSSFDLRQDLRPLFGGNLGIRGYIIAILTRIFNLVQSLRGGFGYPFMPEIQRCSTPFPSLGVTAKETVVIRSKGEIAQTLTNGKNKGLWFDREMIRFCGQRAVVRKHVNRIIHEATGKMVLMKTPCVMLENIVATGEFLRLCPQHEYIFWREAWLKRTDSEQQHVSEVQDQPQWQTPL